MLSESDPVYFEDGMMRPLKVGQIVFKASPPISLLTVLFIIKFWELNSAHSLRAIPFKK